MPMGSLSAIPHRNSANLPTAAKPLILALKTTNLTNATSSHSVTSPVTLAGKSSAIQAVFQLVASMFQSKIVTTTILAQPTFATVASAITRPARTPILANLKAAMLLLEDVLSLTLPRQPVTTTTRAQMILVSVASASTLI